jgi:hypothetical protein
MKKKLLPENCNFQDLPSEALDILEKMIDNRFEYLVEKMYENHSYALNIHENKYLPEKKKMYQILKNELDTARIK